MPANLAVVAPPALIAGMARSYKGSIALVKYPGYKGQQGEV